jgi:hypothetical protein
MRVTKTEKQEKQDEQAKPPSHAHLWYQQPEPTQRPPQTKSKDFQSLPFSAKFVESLMKSVQDEKGGFDNRDNAKIIKKNTGKK